MANKRGRGKKRKRETKKPRQNVPPHFKLLPTESLTITWNFYNYENKRNWSTFGSCLKNSVHYIEGKIVSTGLKFSILGKRVNVLQF